jgi:hypothetical protein
LALVLSAAATAGDGRGTGVICAAVRFKGGGAMDAIRSASRDMAISPDALSTGRWAVAKLLAMALSIATFRTIAKPNRDAAFSRIHG